MLQTIELAPLLEGEAEISTTDRNARAFVAVVENRIGRKGKRVRPHRGVRIVIPLLRHSFFALERGLATRLFSQPNPVQPGVCCQRDAQLPKGGHHENRENKRSVVPPGNLQRLGRRPGLLDAHASRERVRPLFSGGGSGFGENAPRGARATRSGGGRRVGCVSRSSSLALRGRPPRAGQVRSAISPCRGSSSIWRKCTDFRFLSSARMCRGFERESEKSNSQRRVATR